MALGYQNPFYLKQAQQKQQSLYNGRVLLEKHDPPDVYDSKETLQLAQESRLKMKQLKKEIKPTNYAKINKLSEVFVSQKAKLREQVYFSNTSKTATNTISKSFLIPDDEFSDDTPSVAQKFLNEIIKDEIDPIVNQVDARIQNFENYFVKEAAKFVRDFKSLAKEANKSLDKITVLEKENDRLLRAVVSQDIMSIVQNPSVLDTSNLQTELDRTKEKLETSYNDMQNQIKRLQAQLGDLKGVDITAKTRRPQPKSVLNYVNAMNSRANKPSVNVLKGKIHKKHKKKVKKPKKLWSKERLASPKSSKPRLYLRWSPTRRIFYCSGKLIESNDSECQSESSKSDNGKSKASTHKPKLFPNSKQRLHLLHMDLCGPIRVESINGKRVYNRRTKKIMEIMNVTFDQLLAMDFEQRNSKPKLQGMTSGQISSGLDLIYAPSIITSQKPTERELELLFEAMYDDYIGDQLSTATRTAPTPQVLQTLTTSTTTVNTTPTPTNSSLQAADTPNTSHDVDELQQQHVQ
ncbi:hypothetical protein Tco_0603148 [Tanacetum coccineum]